jgi:hypothetical protein
MKDTIKKICRIGRLAQGDGTSASVYINAEIKEGVLTISGVIGPLRSGNCRGSCGQIDTNFKHRNEEDNDPRTTEPIPPEAFKFAKGWDKTKWLDLLDIWKRWHLNDLKAECEHQRILIPGIEKKKGKEFFYASNLDNIWKIPEMNKCPLCGYQYGSAWKKVKLPERVIKFIKELPDADKPPAWC